jgi:hypothetical protein
VFQASGDSCGICETLDGTNASAPAHDNCRRQTVTKEDDDDCTWDYSGVSHRTGGPGRWDAIFGAELTVTCADGSDAGGQSVEVDLSGYTGEADGIFDYIHDQLQDEANELCSGCPEGDTDLVA